MKYLVNGLLLLACGSSVFAMQTNAQRDAFRLYSQATYFSVSNDTGEHTSLATLNARTGSPLMNLVMGRPRDESFKKIAHEFNNDFHLWSLPEEDQESRQKLESTGRYHYLADISYIECDAIIPVEKEWLPLAQNKLKIDGVEIARVNKENFAEFVQNQSEIFYSFPVESIEKFYTRIDVCNSAKNSHAFVAYYQGKPVGSVMMHSDSQDTLGVYNLGVVSEFRCKGIGRLLLLSAYNRILKPNTLKKIVGVTNLPEFFEQFKAEEMLKSVVYYGSSGQEHSSLEKDDIK